MLCMVQELLRGASLLEGVGAIVPVNGTEDFELSPSRALKPVSASSPDELREMDPEVIGYG